jgi:hypothetical protein
VIYNGLSCSLQQSFGSAPSLQSMIYSVCKDRFSTRRCTRLCRSRRIHGVHDGAPFDSAPWQPMSVQYAWRALHYQTVTTVCRVRLQALYNYYCCSFILLPVQFLISGGCDVGLALQFGAQHFVVAACMHDGGTSHSSHSSAGALLYLQSLTHGSALAVAVAVVPVVALRCSCRCSCSCCGICSCS